MGFSIWFVESSRIPIEYRMSYYGGIQFGYMRGAGEPVFEHDFVGKDMVKEINERPCRKKG